ncbi:uncharacterized protein SPPG_03321 [Spizellomyces punctatus DAOM BR117]|uniref:LIM interaction domain-containing protein n=1 Tax=Spizellomyces punctatus (strain DAOM BR117) TaxID=645134 RepID=A0A0L0HK87_SPIPD|nr:uncharacterized protein SPPG_03321 [Spizellomyces punctatus DAOM BR117]KND01522.1 hypothetical protein SPPG_03321 [Spizellomyces punctatus DAOM BR117]|eukprot:XP_016609561.1 hypothetical protein SPPG_03321 [Spizellomyces punctatus DAOM BR117]
MFGPQIVQRPFIQAANPYTMHVPAHRLQHAQQQSPALHHPPTAPIQTQQPAAPHQPSPQFATPIPPQPTISNQGTSRARPSPSPIPSRPIHHPIPTQHPPTPQQPPQLHPHPQMIGQFRVPEVPEGRRVSLSQPSAVIAEGACTLRLLKFAKALDPGDDNRNTLSYWQRFTTDFFSHNGLFVLDYKIPGADPRSFKLTTAMLPRYLQTSHESGVMRLQMLLTDPTETQTSRDIIVKCPSTSFIYTYAGGIKVIHEGSLSATFSSAGRLDYFKLEISSQTEFVARTALEKDTIQVLSDELKVEGQSEAETASCRGQVQSQVDGLKNVKERVYAPESPLEGSNGCGITLRAMRCLEIAEVVYSMQDLIPWSVQKNAEGGSMGPKQALRECSRQILAQWRQRDGSFSSTNYNVPNYLVPDSDTLRTPVLPTGLKPLHHMVQLTPIAITPTSAASADYLGDYWMDSPAFAGRKRPPPIDTSDQGRGPKKRATPSPRKTKQPKVGSGRGRRGSMTASG